ncbi:EndoU domain-containing protein [Goodfellowiella coeruleoviolacea]|uniref:EndoU nuclease n=1 Tax=Goodfellowiella coeruleoviolacea TaxID=334858 RepID=A0AAE3GF82_9PSEU|nr:EndoU domain-containing protein [Goodfellowiella coeruleoviolacea]MCP2165058.1 EndoU nuclease [Goodfellowiella coeruleoviolacea]
MGHLDQLVYHVSDLTDEIVGILVVVGAGSTRNDFGLAVARFGELRARMPGLVAHCEKARQHVATWLGRALGMTLAGRPVYPLPDEVPAPTPFALPKYPLREWVDTHLFEGHLRGTLLSGVHHFQDGVLPPGMFLEDRAPDDSNGVFAAKVGQALPDGEVAEKEFSTFFPSHWSREEVAHAIRSAFADRRRPAPSAQNQNPRRSLWEGYYRGVRIRGFVLPGKDAMTATFDDVGTAWPMYEPGRMR